MKESHGGHIDARGLQCPRPVLEARRAMAALQAGEVLWVDADDPLADVDLEAWCVRAGHEFLGAEDIAGGRRFRIRKGPCPVW